MRSTTRASGATGARCCWCGPGKVSQRVHPRRTSSRRRVYQGFSFQSTPPLSPQRTPRNTTPSPSSPNLRARRPRCTVSSSTVVLSPVATGRTRTAAEPPQLETCVCVCVFTPHKCLCEPSLEGAPHHRHHQSLYSPSQMKTGIMKVIWVW